ncbi:MAG: cytochrome P450 [Candidatus Thermoplasmatota archaeon]|jgi:unspecific monooxygenase|nr:cytochrome P450 [Candidatus Thermoplasmatota archaeon]
MQIPDYRDEPFEWYREMRNKAPVVKDGNSVFLFRYDDCKEVLGNFRVFSSQFRDFMDKEVAAQLNMMAAPSILILDPPKHTKMRNLVNRAFTPRRIQSYEGEIRKISEGLLDQQKNTVFDLVSSLSYPLPVLVISRILGVPEENMTRFKEWSDKLAMNLGRMGVDMALQKEMSDYFGKLIEERKHSLGDDLISLLIESEVDGERLTKQEITGFSILLLAAGNETTTNLIGNSILTLSEYPGTFQLLKEKPYLIQSTVEESLRYRSPVQSTRRVAKENYSIGGVEIGRGDFVSVFLGSANRDEEIFSEPEKFIPDRKENRHIAFGEGVHFCLGAPLARLEAKVALETVTARYGNLRVIKPSPDDRLDSDIMYGYRKLMVQKEN